MPFYPRYRRSSCRKVFEGKKWHYDVWKLDFCETCAEYCLDKHKRPKFDDDKRRV